VKKVPNECWKMCVRLIRNGSEEIGEIALAVSEILVHCPQTEKLFGVDLKELHREWIFFAV